MPKERNYRSSGEDNGNGEPPTVLNMAEASVRAGDANIQYILKHKLAPQKSIEYLKQAVGMYNLALYAASHYQREQGNVAARISEHVQKQIKAVEESGRIPKSDLESLLKTEETEEQGEGRTAGRETGRKVAAAFIGLSLVSLAVVFIKSTGFVIGGSAVNSVFGAASFVFGLVALVFSLKK